MNRFGSMTIDDLDEVMRIEEESFAIPFTKGMFADLLSQEPFAGTILREGDSIAGYILYSRIIDEMEILSIAVAQEYRRRGVGAQLMEHVIDVARRHEVRVISLDVRRTNEPAVALYEKFGFKPEGVRHGYYHNNNEDAIIMNRYV
jgi:ribosomal-protein-alanine N-acetyltransferase